MAIDFDKMFARAVREDKRPPVIRIINTPPRHYFTREVPRVLDKVTEGIEYPMSDAARAGHEAGLRARELPLTRKVLHVNALRRVPGEWVDAPLRAPRHKRKRWMTDSYHRRIQKKWDKQAKGKTVKVPRTEHVILSLSRIAVDKIAKATRRSGPRNGNATVEDLTIPHEGKFQPLRVVANYKDMSVAFKTRDQEIVATDEDLNAAEWVTLTMKPPKPRKEED